MADEKTNEETQDEAAAEVEATDAPEGVADVENVPEEAAPEESEATAPEPEASAEGAEPEASSTEEPAEGPPTDETGEPVAEAVEEPEPTEEPAEGAAEDAPAAEPEPRGEAAHKKKKKRLPRPLRRQRPKPVRERPAERKAIVRLPKPEHERGRRQERQGTVVSAAADKTIVVRVDVVKVHPMYKKVVKRSTKLHVHDEQNEAKIGDVVRVVETRPLSKLKRWRLQEVVEAAK